MPNSNPVKKIDSLSVRDFLKEYADHLKLELVAGKRGLRRAIREGSVNRPSLALTGFYRYFANKRLQVLGASEMTYLRSLDEEKQRKRLSKLIEHTIPCLVIARNYLPLPVMTEIAETRGLPILRTSMITMNFINVNRIFKFIDTKGYKIIFLPLFIRVIDYLIIKTRNCNFIIFVMQR